MYLIYKATNKTNGKFYIGRCHGPVKSREMKHWWYAKNKNANTPFPNALRKYGRDAFEWSIVEEVTAETAGEREVFWIDKLQPQYNATLGGDGGRYGIVCPEHVRESISKANSKPVLCVETGEVFSSAKEAGISLGKPKGYSNISNVLRGKAEKAYGFHWEYAK
ncbi:hypothetical protein [Synechococcus phage S-H34]|uniref:GIY-YIG domain-containing protein n=1 Tax=Synechococcus phage S-H34 TaxID=2718942 RepID=A0A6G8R682_9CAUD|nr:homing endonuclease [Synechococcus phage S-H34]QIN96892.1 hypothetical protein [Synechococcus phage S-H34]